MLEPTLSEQLVAAARSTAGVRFLDRREHETFHPYRDILARARRVSGGLVALGLRSGERVALILPTGIEFYDAFFGSLLAGIVPVPLYPAVRLGRLEAYHDRCAAMLRACGARMVVTNRMIRRVLGRTVEKAPLDLGCRTVDSLSSRDRAPVAISPDQTAFIQFSSGTTVKPKPVELTHRQITANIEAIAGAILRVHPENGGVIHSGVSWLPLYHDMGLVGGVLTAVARQRMLTLIPPELFVSNPAVWLRTLSRHHGTISPAPNFAFGLCTDRITDAELAGVDLSSWRVALNGAEPVTPSVLQRFIDRFSAVGFRPEALTPVYGLAEAALAVTFADLRRPFRWSCFDREQLGADGRAVRGARGTALVNLGAPLPGFALCIADREGHDLGELRVGRVLVRGPSIMKGYLGMDVLTRRVLRDGWLDTGDTGFLDGGSLYLYGRAKDLIIMRGCNYAPQDIEQALDGTAGVRIGCSAAVGIVPEGGDGEELFVFVERARQSSVEPKELATRLSRRITSRLGLVPARVVVLAPGTLPRTSSGKIRRAETRRLFLAGRLRPPDRVDMLHLAGEMVRSQVGFVRKHFRSERSRAQRSGPRISRGHTHSR